MLVWLCTGAASAQSAAPRSAEEILADTDLVVAGTVQEAHAEWLDRSVGSIATVYSLKLQHTVFDHRALVAGLRDADGLRLRFAGGEIGDQGFRIAGVPAMTVGETVVLFVSARDLGSACPLAGGAAGLFRVSSTNTVCDAAGSPVTRRYLSTEEDRPGGFTCADFLQEVARARPLVNALQSPRGGSTRQSDCGVPICQPIRVAPEDRRDPPHPSGAIPAPITGGTRRAAASGGGGCQNPNGVRPLFGYSLTIPDLYSAPSPWRAAVRRGIGRWRTYASGVFFDYVGTHNTYGFFNGFNDFAFADDAGMQTAYGITFGSYITYTALRTVRQNHQWNIVEADILARFDAGWTTDPQQAHLGRAYLLEGIFARELGYAVGMDRQGNCAPNSNCNSVMNNGPGPIDLLSALVAAPYRVDIEKLLAPDMYPLNSTNITDFGIHLFRTVGGPTGIPGGVRAAWASHPASVTRGNSFALQGFSAEHLIGVGSAPTVEFRLTPARGSLAGAIVCNRVQLPFLSNSSIVTNASVTVPGHTPPGSYHLAAVVVSPDGNAHNDVSWSGSPLRVDLPLHTLRVDAAPAPTRTIVTFSVNGGPHQDHWTPVAQNHPEGTGLDLWAIPLANRRPFDRWIVDGVPQTPGNVHTRVTMNAAHTLVAQYGAPFLYGSYRAYGTGCGGSTTCASLNGSAPSLAGLTVPTRRRFALQLAGLPPTVVTSAELRIRANRSLSIPIEIQAQDPATGGPSGVTLASTTLQASTQSVWQRATFANPVTLPAGDYFLLLESPGPELELPVAASGNLGNHHVEIAPGNWVGPFALEWAWRILCPGAGPTLTNVGTPEIGRPVTIRLDQAPPAHQAFLMTGFSNTSWGPRPLPFSLDPLGAPGCSVLASCEVVDSVTTSSIGTASVTLRIPGSLQFYGARFYNQWAVLDPSANPLGLRLSNAGSGFVGHP